MTLFNMYAGMKFFDRPDSWYEPDDEEDFDEIALNWICENTNMPASMIDVELMEDVIDRLKCHDDSLLSADFIAEINNWFDDYVKNCEDEQEYLKQIQREERGE